MIWWWSKNFYILYLHWWQTFEITVYWTLLKYQSKVYHGKKHMIAGCFLQIFLLIFPWLSSKLRNLFSSYLQGFGQILGSQSPGKRLLILGKHQGCHYIDLKKRCFMMWYDFSWCFKVSDVLRKARNRPEILNFLVLRCFDPYHPRACEILQRP